VLKYRIKKSFKDRHLFSDMLFYLYSFFYHIVEVACATKVCSGKDLRPMLRLCCLVWQMVIPSQKAMRMLNSAQA